MTGAISESIARSWIERWDAQQEVYLPDRENRFTALIDAVAESAGRDDPLVADLGCGPGSLSVRLLDQLPKAAVVAVDADPLLLGLAEAAYAADSRLRFLELDLREPGWSARLGLDRQADAVVSTTALHWLWPAELTAMYAEVATMLRPGGLLLNGDHLAEDQTTAPTLYRLGRVLNEREARRQPPGTRAEDWASWWAAVKLDPDLTALVADRESRMVKSEHHGSPSGQLAVHVNALRAAGFTELGTLWQRGDNRLLCAVR